MAVAFDAVGPSSAGTSGAGVTSLSWTHTNVGSGVAVAAALAFGINNTNPSSVAVTCGGTSMTQLGSKFGNNASTGVTGEAFLFGLANVGSGAQTVSVTWTNACDIESGSVSYTGAASTTAAAFSAAQTAAGVTTNGTITFTGSTSGNMVTAAFVQGNTLGSSAGTQRWVNNQNSLTGGGSGAQVDIAAGGSVTLTETNANADQWGIVAVEVKAATAAAALGPSMPARPLRRGRRARYRRWQWAQPSSGIQVTAAQGGVTGNGIALRVFVLTGFGGTGGTFSANLAASTTDTGSITTSAGSNVYGASVRAQPTGVSTGSGATVLDDITDSGNGAHYVTLKSLGVGAGAASRGYTSTVSAAADLALLEITSGGSLAEDSSSPAAVSDTAHTQVTTALFSPPLGAALVALVASNGGAGVTTMTVSDSTGLTWTEGPHSNPSSTGYAGVWTAGLPTGPPPGVATLTASIDFTAPPAVIEQAIATLAAAASITAPVSAQLAPATLQPVFTVNSPAVTQLAPATLAPAFTVAGPVSTQLAPATLQVAGSVTAPVSTLIQNIVTTLSAAWSLTSPAVQLAPATLLPAFSVTSPAMRELAPATLAATFAVSSPVSTLIVPATLSAAWSVSDTAILLAPATLAAVFAITSPDAALVAPASMIITGSLTGSAGQGAALTAGFTLTSPAQQLAPATLAGSFTISSPAVQDAPAVLAAGLAVAAPDVSLRAPATLQAAASLASVPAILAPATLAAQVVLTASPQQLAPASLAAQVTLNSPAAVQWEAAVLAAAFAVSTTPPPVQGAVTLQPAWSLTAAGIMIPLQLVSGLRAGEAHTAWRAGEAHIMWDAGEAHIAWDAGESHMAEYAAGRAHVAWLAGEAHT